jgi:hypothetical protein
MMQGEYNMAYSLSEYYLFKEFGWEFLMHLRSKYDPRWMGDVLYGEDREVDELCRK